MRTHYNPKNNPRVIIIQKLYGKFYNEDDDLVKKIETGNHPFGVYAEGDFAYVANVYDDSVSIINLVDWSKYEFMVGAHPYNVRVHNKIAYVTNTIDDTITIYDLGSKKIIKTLHIME